MHDIRASVILAEDLDEKSIINIIDTLPSNKNNTICMNLILKINIKITKEIKIGYDIVLLDKNKNFEAELGELAIGNHNNGVKEIKDNKEEADAQKTKSRKHTSLQPYNISTIRKKYLTLPVLEKGSYEFVVYEKYENKNIILDTFQFEIVDEEKN